MTFVLQYLREHMRLLLSDLLFTAIFAIVFYLYHLPLSAVLYSAAICALIGSIFLGNSMYRAYKKHILLTKLTTLQSNVLKHELPTPTTAAERDCQAIIQKLCMEMETIEEQYTQSNQEMIDYFTIWVHQIKTPIASMRLNLEAEDTRLSQRLKSDLLHIEHYVEMVLTYLKMGAESTDYVFADVSLDKIIRENIRKLRGDFIMKKLKLIYEPVRETVVSDEKWLSFVIEQLLSNAVKYTSEGSVTIFSEEPKTLSIRDTGLGIATGELPRIFERGYTGSNGRRDKRASGLGLFLCKEICKRLGAEIFITSRIEAGTTVKIDLSFLKNPMNE